MLKFRFYQMAIFLSIYVVLFYVVLHFNLNILSMRYTFILGLLLINLFPESKLWDQLELPDIQPHLLTPGFWIDKHPKPDELILTPQAINKLNHNLYKKGFYVHPLYVESRISGLMVSNYIQQDLNWIKRYIKYDTNGQRRRDPAFSDFLKSLIGFQFSAKTAIQFGIITKSSSLRAFPTTMILARNTNNYDFDILQRSSIAFNQEIAIYHTSSDGRWFYIQSPSGTGWIPTNAVAIGSKQLIKDYIHKKNHSGVVIEPIARIFIEDKHIKVPMGTYLFISNENQHTYSLTLPINKSGKLFFKTGSIKKHLLSPKPLNYTYKNVVSQSFKMLGQPYKWGGDGLHSDCSSFLQQVYQTMAIQLPRASNLQIKHLDNIVDLKAYSAKSKQKIIKNYSPGATLVFLRGPNHIMLYLGQFNQKPYIIHNTWSFNNKLNQEEFIKKVVVSSFNLGQGKPGNLMDRLTSISSFR